MKYPMDLHDETFKAMADSTRRQILAALCQQSREAGELARLVGLAPNAVSFHLRALKSAELVNVQRDGRHLRYSIEPGTMRAWREQLDAMFPADQLAAGNQPAADHRHENSKSDWHKNVGDNRHENVVQYEPVWPTPTQRTRPHEAARADAIETSRVDVPRSIVQDDDLPTELL